MFKLELKSTIVLALNFFKTFPHLSSCGEGSEIEVNVRTNISYDPCHNMCIFGLPFGMCLLVRHGVDTVNITLKLLAFHKDI